MSAEKLLRQLLEKSEIDAKQLAIYEVNGKMLSYAEIKKQKKILETINKWYQENKGKSYSEKPEASNKDVDAKIMGMLSQNNFLKNHQGLKDSFVKDELEDTSNGVFGFTGYQTIGIKSALSAACFVAGKALFSSPLIKYPLYLLGMLGLGSSAKDISSFDNKYKRYFTNKAAPHFDSMEKKSLGARVAEFDAEYDNVLNGKKLGNVKCASFELHENMASEKSSKLDIDKKYISIDGKSYSYKELYKQYEILAKIRAKIAYKMHNKEYFDVNDEANASFDAEILKLLQAGNIHKFKFLDASYQSESPNFFKKAWNFIKSIFTLNDEREGHSLGARCTILCDKYESFLLGTKKNKTKLAGIEFPRFSMEKSFHKKHKINTGTFAVLREKALTEKVEKLQGNSKKQEEYMYSRHQLSKVKEETNFDFTAEDDGLDRTKIIENLHKSMTTFSEYFNEMTNQISEEIKKEGIQKGEESKKGFEKFKKILLEKQENEKLDEIIESYQDCKRNYDIFKEHNITLNEENEDEKQLKAFIPGMEGAMNDFKNVCDEAGISLEEAAEPEAAGDEFEKQFEAFKAEFAPFDGKFKNILESVQTELQQVPQEAILAEAGRRLGKDSNLIASFEKLDNEYKKLNETFKKLDEEKKKNCQESMNAWGQQLKFFKDACTRAGVDCKPNETEGELNTIEKELELKNKLLNDKTKPIKERYEAFTAMSASLDKLTSMKFDGDGQNAKEKESILEFYNKSITNFVDEYKDTIRKIEADEVDIEEPEEKVIAKAASKERQKQNEEESKHDGGPDETKENVTQAQDELFEIIDELKFQLTDTKLYLFNNFDENSNPLPGNSVVVNKKGHAYFMRDSQFVKIDGNVVKVEGIDTKGLTVVPGCENTERQKNSLTAQIIEDAVVKAKLPDLANFEKSLFKSMLPKNFVTGVVAKLIPYKDEISKLNIRKKTEFDNTINELISKINSCVNNYLEDFNKVQQAYGFGNCNMPAKMWQIIAAKRQDILDVDDLVDLKECLPGNTQLDSAIGQLTGIIAAGYDSFRKEQPGFKRAVDSMFAGFNSSGAEHVLPSVAVIRQAVAESNKAKGFTEVVLDKHARKCRRRSVRRR